MNLDVLNKTVCTFFIMLLLTRILGKKQMGQLTYFNYVTGIVFGSIAGSIIAEKQLTFFEGLTGLVSWTCLTLIIEYISYKLGWTRSTLDGQPTIIIKEGKILRKAMSQMRLDLDDLMMLLRTNGIFTLSEVAYAILESNGQLSVAKKGDQQTITKKDIGIQPETNLQVPGALIVEGKILKKNLRELNVNEQWLIEQLKLNGISSVKQVFFAELKTDRTVYINMY